MFVGIDIVDNVRAEKLINNKAFLNKYFTESEINYVNDTVNRVMRLAGIFACKEAFVKALEVGVGAGVNLKEVEVCHKESGAPYLELHGSAKQLAMELGLAEIKISISHTDNISTAVCVCL